MVQLSRRTRWGRQAQHPARSGAVLPGPASCSCGRGQAAACLRCIAEPPEVPVSCAELPALPCSSRGCRRSLPREVTGERCRRESSCRTPRTEAGVGSQRVNSRKCKTRWGGLVCGDGAWEQSGATLQCGARSVTPETALPSQVSKKRTHSFSDSLCRDISAI